MPSGYQLRAARSLIGWGQRRLAAAAKVDPTTIVRMESAGDKPVGGSAASLQAVLAALHKAGVEITADGVRLIKR